MTPSPLALVAICPFLASAALAGEPYGHLVAVAPASDGPVVYRLLAVQEAARAGVPFALVDAVMKIESDYRPDRVGDVGEIGLMQVRPATAALLGFSGDARTLATPATNIHYGTMYLARAWRLADGNVCRALMKYRAGHGETVMSDRSATYCARAKAHLAATGSALAATIHPSDLVADDAATAASVPASGKVGSGFWTRFEARIRRINARIEARWRRVAAR